MFQIILLERRYRKLSIVNTELLFSFLRIFLSSNHSVTRSAVEVLIIDNKLTHDYIEDKVMTRNIEMSISLHLAQNETFKN
jgi:hypothetical protein